MLKAGDGEGVRRAPLIASLNGSLARLVIIATSVLLAASVAQLIVQASVVFESSIPAVFGGPVWDLLFGTEWGRLWLWRVALGTASAIAVIVAWRRETTSRWRYSERRAGRGGTADDQPHQSCGGDRQCAN